MKNPRWSNEKINQRTISILFTHRGPDPLCTKRMVAPVLAVEHRLPTNTSSGIPFTLSKKKSNVLVHTFASVYVAMKTIIKKNTHTHKITIKLQMFWAQ